MSGAVTVTPVGAGYQTTGSQHAYDYTGLTPVNGRGYHLHVGVGTATGNDPLAPLVTSDTGLTFVLVGWEEDSTSPDRITALYRAGKTTGLVAGKITITHPTTAHVYAYAQAQLVEIVGATVGTDGADLIRTVGATPQVTVADSGNVAVATKTIALPAAPAASSNNVSIVYAGGTQKLVNLRIDPTDTGWTKLYELDIGSGKNSTLAAWWKDDLDQSATIEVRLDGDDLTADTAKLQAIIVEVVAAASGAGTGEVLPTFTRVWPAGHTRITDGTSDALPSTTTVTGKAYILAVHHAVANGTTPVAPSTIDFGTGLVFTEVHNQLHTSSSWARTWRYYRGVCTAGATVSPTLAWASQSQAQVLAELIRVDDGDTSASGANLVAAYTSVEVSHTQTAATTQRIERTAPFESGAPNASLAFFAKHLVGTYVPSADPVWTELLDRSSSDVATTIAVYTFAGAPTPLEAEVVSKATDGVTNQSAFWMGTWFEVRGATTATATDQDLGGETVTWADEDDPTGATVYYDEQWALAVEELTVDRTTPPTGGVPPSGGGGPAGTLGPGASSTTLDLAIRVRDAHLTLTDEVAAWDTLTITMRWQDLSTWLLEMPSATVAARNIIAPGAGIMVIRNNRTLISGPVLGWEMRLSVEGGVPRFVTMAHGSDDTWALTRRLATPDPTLAGPPYNTAHADVRSGPGETLMLGYVNDNMGPAATPARRWPYLTVAADQFRGAPDTPDAPMPQVSARFQTVFDIVQQTAIQTGLGFRVTQVPNAADPTIWDLRFEVLGGTDRSDDCFFGFDLGNLAGYQWGLEVPAATYLYVAGQGEGAAREIIERANQGDLSTWGRHEGFRDRRDVDLGDVAGLEAAAQQGLAEVAARPSLAMSVIDGLEGTRYLLDYVVGDTVTVLIPSVAPTDPTPVTYGAAGATYGSIFAGHTYGTFGGSRSDVAAARIVDRVRSVSLVYRPSDGGMVESIDPTIGTDQPGASNAAALRELARRMSLQERTR